MKKLLVGLMVAGLILLGTVCFAEEIPTPEVKIPELSLKMAATDVKTAIEMRPVSLVEYFDFGIDFVSTLLARLAKTAQPAYLFNGQMAVAVSIFEQTAFDIVWGISQSGNQFYGIEVKNLPLSGVLWGIFTKVHPILTYYSEDGGYFTAGICYQFRAD